MVKKEKIVILGGGYAGLLTAVTLQKKVHGKRAEITLVNKNDYHYLTTKVHESGAGTIQAESIVFPIKELIDSERVNFIKDEVIGIDIATKTVTLKNNELNYDYLVLTIGGVPQTYGLPGVNEHAFFLFDWEGTNRLRWHIEEQIEKYLEDHDEKRLCFVIGGAGFSGMEFIYELTEKLPELCDEYGIGLDLVKVICVEAHDELLKGYESSMVKDAKKAFEKIPAEFRTGTTIASCTETEVRFTDGSTIETNTFIWAGGVKGNPLLEGLGFKTFRDGRVIVNEYCEVPGYRDVYVLGDASVSFSPEGNPYPPTAQIALQQGQYCGRNLAAKIYGVAIKPFKYIHRGTVMSMGHKNATGVVYGKAIHGRFASFMKWVIEKRYFFMLGGPRLLLKEIKK
ncbi:FAD-dependent oxidoreductase [Neobacillus piezotolerans]|uniref:FAD-dependent oxidoreductase n=1 Tax=Neobacillus piezotolerans TaxID=2259171 RepID=A0A3D8GVY4_9BACI|nr:NAD(P)/FAD-dependent oxidoreductase [Neobacillus piezotolerans]RDU38321.1 FAD-dependent oxidoreductase [Neobacillus piezotolerans]